jgi:hypothetical protein
LEFFNTIRTVLPFGIGPVNAHEARVSGLWLRTWLRRWTTDCVPMNVTPQELADALSSVNDRGSNRLPFLLTSEDERGNLFASTRI